MRRRPPRVVESGQPGGPPADPGPFVLADWLDETERPLPHHWSSDSPGDTQEWRRIRAWRRYLDADRTAWDSWGRANGYDPDAKYTTPEGRRWHDFRHGGKERDQ